MLYFQILWHHRVSWGTRFEPSTTQSEKFDPEARFIRKYLPELVRVPDRHIHAPWRVSPLEQQACGAVIGRDYPAPIVDVARKGALELFGR